MNVREEDRQKSSCTGRGLGLAAAAIGVGVGAALFYFFNQRQEHPDTEGATSEGWQAEQANALTEESDSYTTISEHSTSDTSLNSTSSYPTDIASFSLTSDDSDSESENSDNVYEEEYSLESEISESDVMYETGYMSMGHMRAQDIDTDWETSMEWDVTNESTDIPSMETRSPLLSFLTSISTAVSPNYVRRSTEDDRLKKLREQRFRERSWTIEECTICFDVMLQNQELMKLSCAHNFHTQCIMPWLQEKQSCPICRKQV